MKKSIYLVLFTIFCCSFSAQAQENNQIQELKKQKKHIKSNEKAQLKEKVKAINEKLEQGTITKERAEELKEKAAEKHARNIENQLTIIDNSIELIQRNPHWQLDSISDWEYSRTARSKNPENDSLPLATTYSYLVYSFGLQNATGGPYSIFESPYKNWGSRYFSIGYEFATVLNKAGSIRFKYALAFQFNGLKPKRHKRFYENNGNVFLGDPQANEVNKSKFRIDNLVIPLHLEFGPAEIVKGEEERFYSTADKFKIGIGGFVGLNLKTIQKLKYEEGGQNYKRKIIGGFQTNSLLYGLSAYVGYGDFALYARYSLNPLFEGQSFDQHMFALGLRFSSGIFSD